MRVPADVVVYDEIGQLLVFAEVRGQAETTEQWAAEVRREVLASAKKFVPRYFLVIARDFTYFWLTAVPVDVLPDTKIATDDLFRTYFRSVDSTAGSINYSSMDLLVGIWLQELTEQNPRALEALPPEFDLAKAVENGRIEFALAA
ncbi:MAG TPA: hypothetical protein VEK57_18455 [Thermoanaerobaculia bacterium]|nr:hypothetical protein [Thermoanaerobaculia bacterium]